MGKFGVWPVLVATLMVVGCLADKDNPTILLRPPGQTSGQNSPVFSSSIDSIPLGSSSQQQSVFSKGPSIAHSTASASASGKEQGGSQGGRNNSPWYNQGSSGFNFDYNGGGGEAGSATSAVHATSSGSGSYYEQPPQHTGSHQVASSVSASANSDGYAPAPGGQGPYTYYYQHYPAGSSPGGHGWSGGGNDGGGGLFDGGGGFGDLGIPGLAGAGGIAGVGVVKAAKVLLAVGKGILAVKPFLILGLLLLIAIPVLLLLLPIPIITITGQPTALRTARSSQITSYLTQLSGKVLNSEECLERIICKLPHPPEKYQTKAKLIWDEYGSRMVSNPRVSRGLNAYFDSSSQKNKNLKCDQRFKCSNKYL